MVPYLTFAHEENVRDLVVKKLVDGSQESAYKQSLAVELAPYTKYDVPYVLDGIRAVALIPWFRIELS